MHQRASLHCSQEENGRRAAACDSRCVWVVVLLGEGEVRCEQLDMVIKWIGDFQAASRQPNEEVAFDVLCGDFNFDNCSPGPSITVFQSVLFISYLLLKQL